MRSPAAMLRSATAGSVSTVFALLMAGMLGATGLAVDFGQSFRVKLRAQNAVDMAVLAGVAAKTDPAVYSGVQGEMSKDERVEIAKKFFASNGHELPNVDSATFAYQGDVLVGTVSLKVETTLLRILNKEYLTIAVEGRATSSPIRAPLCFMAMNPTRKHTLELHDSVSVIAPDCHIYGNSDHFDDVVDLHTSENHLVGKSVQAIGYGHHFLNNVVPPLEHAPELIPDPLAGMALPPAGTCQFSSTKVESATRTLTPGIYCGGLTIKDGARVTLTPGLYIIKSGALSIEESEVVGEGVTIAFGDAAGVLEVRAAVVRLSAPTSGEYAGIVMMGRQEVEHTFEESHLDMHGVVYLPKGSISWKHAGDRPMTAQWSAWIVDGVSWTGSGKLFFNFDLKSSSIPYPDTLNVIPRPGSARLM